MNKILITAGPTREFIDPVRYISNCSSGKMGYALANAAIETGAEVILISGPTDLPIPGRVKLIDVVTAQEMYDAVIQHIADCDVFIGVAAVVDYRPIKIAKQKIKKSADKIVLELERNPDILAEVAALPQRPFVVGFAAETENLIKNATAKLQQKNLDMIIANQVGPNLGFDSDVNEVIILQHEQAMIKLPLASKTELAKKIIKIIFVILAKARIQESPVNTGFPPARE